MNFRVTKSMVLVAAAAATMTVSALAQDKPAAKPPAEPSPSRWDIFAGYSYLAPHGTVQVEHTDGTVIPTDYKAQDGGAVVSGAYFFNKYVGGEVEVGIHQDGSGNSTKYNDGFTTSLCRLDLPFPDCGYHTIRSCPGGRRLCERPVP